MAQTQPDVPGPVEIAGLFGPLDIYVFDQLLRGRLQPGMRVLDAGCGGGRNLVYLLRAGTDVSAADADPAAVAQVRDLAAELRPDLPARQIVCAALEELPFADASFDIVLCSAVLHFAGSEEHFGAMVRELWRVLRPGGILFCRLGSRVGIEPEAIGHGRYRLADGTEWYLVDEAQLVRWTEALGAEWADPLKTTLVHGRRSMTTWVVRKPA